MYKPLQNNISCPNLERKKPSVKSLLQIIYKPPRGLYLETALQYKKQSKNGKFPSNCKASPIDFETQISLHREAPPNIRRSKRAFEKYKPRGLFTEFYRCLILVRASFFIVFDPCTVAI